MQNVYVHVSLSFSLSLSSKGAEPEFRSPRVKLLWDKWRHVWMLAWERQRRLQDKYNYIQELDRVANFSWEDWRKRVRDVAQFQKIFFTYNKRNCVLPVMEQLVTIKTCFRFSVAVLEVHESQKIQTHRFIQEDGQEQRRTYTERGLHSRNYEHQYVFTSLIFFFKTKKKHLEFTVLNFLNILLYRI